MASVYIPVQNSEEEVRVVLDQLPRDASDILDILKAEQAPLDLWLVIAREYFKQGKIEQFRQILEEGSSSDIDEYYADVKYERIAILNALGAYYSYLGKTETKLKEKDEHYVSATKYYNKASRIDMHEPSTWIGKGQLLLAKGEKDNALQAFMIVLGNAPDNVPALLGQASVEFMNGRFSESLQLYKRVLQLYPGCPAAVRLGIGHCRYKLGQLDKARQAFDRVLQASGTVMFYHLDPDNVEALVALGIMDLQANDSVGMRKGMERMQQAFEIYPYCAAALNYLANHFFFTGQHFLVEQLTEIVIAVSTHGPTKSHSYYNLARSYHSKGDYEKAGMYYMQAIKDIENKPQEFVLPYFGLGQVQLKLGELKGSVVNFEKVLEVYPDNCETLKALGHIYTQLGQTNKALEYMRKATKLDPRDAQAFVGLGELLISSDTGAALDSFKMNAFCLRTRNKNSQARTLMKKGGQEVPIEVLNDIGALHFEREEFEYSYSFQSALENFKEALGDGIWISFLDGKENLEQTSASVLGYKDTGIFHKLIESGHSVDVPWNKVTTLFNLARLLEQLHKTETATFLYRLILFKYPGYIDAYLRLAASAKAQNNLPLAIELANEALKVDDKNANALSLLGELELKNDDWVKAKETFRAASDATDGKDSYAILSLGNWNYFAAMRNEKRNPKLEATHLEKAKELYTKVLTQHKSNMYAANGSGIILAEKGQFDIAKDLFTQVQEAASGSVFLQMPDVWVNLAHVYFAQGNFALAVKMYQNCLRKFFCNTDSQILLYLARTHYEAEQWQECKKTLLRAIHLAPSNYTFRFDLGAVMQKSSSSTLQKKKRTADEVRSTVAEAENAVRVFSQLSAASDLHVHGFDSKKIQTHVQYCTHLLEAAKVHREAAEHEELQNRQRLEVARQAALAEEARRKAEEQRKYQLEKRKQEEELRRLKQEEENFQRIKEQWKNTTPGSNKRKDRVEDDDGEGRPSERKRKKGGKRRKKDKSSRARHYEDDEEEVATMDDHNEVEDEDPNTKYNREEDNQEGEEEPVDDDAHDLLAAAGLEDPDADDDEVPSSAVRRRRALSSSDEEGELMESQANTSPQRESSPGRQEESNAEGEEEANLDDNEEEGS
ncbi:rna polymerase-associated protein ctr9 [Arabis alpina]|uniref:Rna polymerase-associated protein ctr9 n=1 Tax=Arabis alpina TaxID=50452 RepID=A0A087HCN9_ARAAL|nr:rna polymerase-associated protein ctr9 [Arabis alpina]